MQLLWLIETCIHIAQLHKITEKDLGLTATMFKSFFLSLVTGCILAVPYFVAFCDQRAGSFITGYHVLHQ